MNIPATIGAALAGAARELAAAGIDNARAEARMLVGHATNVGPETIIGYPDRLLDGRQRDALGEAVRRRARREPMAHLLGAREFWSLDFAVTPDVLTPRPDSETVVEAALGQIADRAAALDILDLGTGSGCLMLALLSELPNARGLGVDISPAAAAIARRNAERLGLARRARFAVADWDCGLAGAFAVVVANPPYVPSGEIGRLAPEVARFEPRMALDGGADGLESLRAVAPAIARTIAADGTALVEIGAGQAAAAVDLMAQCGLAVDRVAADLSGIPRCLVLRPGSVLIGC